MIDKRFVVLKTEALTEGLKQLGCVFSDFNKHKNKTITTHEKKPLDWFKLLDSETIKLINDVYYKDFELFGYEML